MSEASAPTNHDRPDPPETPAKPIPLPEAEGRGRKARTVRIQDILAAHARALDVRLEEGMRDIRLAMDSAIRRTEIHEAPMAPQPQPTPPPQAYISYAPQAPAASPIREDVARGLAAQTDERFQALSMRLQKIEDALRKVALGGVAGAELDGKLDALADGMSRLADAEDQLLDRFIEAQRQGLEDLTRRVGAGVAAVIRALQNELTQTVRRLELTSDASGEAAADEASRLERTMMAIAEHQESVLDERLSEIRRSMGLPEPLMDGRVTTQRTRDPEVSD